MIENVKDIYRWNGEDVDDNDQDEDEDEDYERFVGHKWSDLNVKDTRMHSYTW